MSCPHARAKEHLFTPRRVHRPPRFQVVVDLCSGKGFGSVIMAHEFPEARIIMIDYDRTGKMVPLAHDRCSFHRIDIHGATFVNDLAGIIAKVVGGRQDASVAAAGSASLVEKPSSFWAALVGMHLCGTLSTRAVEIYAALPAISALILVPCCLDKRADSELKVEAKRRGVPPYDLKVTTLRGMLQSVENAASSMARDEAMRSNTGGAKSEGAVNRTF